MGSIHDWGGKMVMPQESPNYDADDVMFTFPCLMWEPALEIILLATAIGTATVLCPGRSQVLKVGMVVPYGASHWHYGDERWDFIIAPPEMTLTLGQKVCEDSRTQRLGVAVQFEGDVGD